MQVLNYGIQETILAKILKIQIKNQQLVKKKKT